MPARWATKAKPQIAAVRNKSVSDRIVLVADVIM
jgi:hypothetical protein